MKKGMRKTVFFILGLLTGTYLSAQPLSETQKLYLSGHGCDDMVEWDFFCTDGNNSGKWTKIGVPSCWELQGFGTYQYGMRFYGLPKPEGIANEKGLYKYEFSLPESWKGRQTFIVFEAVMTDAKVTINGRKGGSHQGGFYRFALDVSDRIFYGKKKNRLEVEVAKESENQQVNMAERRADYWNFGGIFRPVYVISKPVHNIDRVAINAGMDGRFKADCYLNQSGAGASLKVSILDSKGREVGHGSCPTRGSDRVEVALQVSKPQLWTAETPALYTAQFTLLDQQGKTLHTHREKFGFRTIEIRKNDGVYVNGSKVIFKGVNRHSFRPESGRTLSKQKNIEDVLLIKSMNMNAVRLSHYPADPEFLDACDSLGLYVENELSGWHWAHETAVGQKLVREMVTRDVNHPSVVFWSNGNEGGFNYELEQEFDRFDPQHRVVLYPWANRNGFETKHYRSWGETLDYMRQPEIFMPTEFLHGLYDGGHGAGLSDYWHIMMGNPRCAGGFLWDLADEGVVRTDRDGVIDCVGNFGADGIVGPHFEKEGSYYTIKQIWCPVQIDSMVKANGHIKLLISNHYDYLNVRGCKFVCQYVQLPALGGTAEKVLKEVTYDGPDIAPHGQGELVVADADSKCHLLRITVKDSVGSDLFTWGFPLEREQRFSSQQAVRHDVQKEEGHLIVKSPSRMYVFSQETGFLTEVIVGGKHVNLSNGPRFIAARRSDRSFDQFYNHDDPDAKKKMTQYTEYKDYGSFQDFSYEYVGDTLILHANYVLGAIDAIQWRFYANEARLDYQYHFGGVVDEMGITFDMPESTVESKSWVGNGPYRVWQNRLEGPQYGYWETSYNDAIPGESFTYPEFKGYFDHVDWMMLKTTEGNIGIQNLGGDYVGVFTPKDGRDHLLYELPATGLSFFKVIPAVRNKVNTTDLNGPSAQPFWADGQYSGSLIFTFE